MLARPRLLAYAARATVALGGGAGPSCRTMAMGLRGPRLHAGVGAATAVPRRAFAAPAAAAEHPLDEFFEPPNEDDPENLTRYAGRAWKMDELRNKVSRPERTHALLPLLLAACTPC
eukprot:COSAG02_NODE_815_length_16868_cov_8.101258_2_plen_117_part_00